MNYERDLHFTMSYDELLNLSYEKETYLTRDAADLISRGITTTRIESIDALRQAFLQVPTDRVMTGYITQATANREAAMALLVSAIRELIGIAKNTFGEKSGVFKTFGSTDLTRLDASGLIRLANTVGQQTNTYLTDMAPHGATAQMITDLEAKAAAMPTLVRAIDKAEGDRKLTTISRHQAANAIYDAVSTMCGTAVVYYSNRNPTKAANYVIYDLESGIQHRNGDVAAKKTVTRDLKGIGANTSFSLKVNEGASLVFYFSKTEGGVAGSKSITVTNNPNNFEPTTAEALGFNHQTGFIYFCIHNPSADEVGNYSVKVA